MYVLTKSFYFSASHIVYGMESGHPEATMHGHNYTVRVEMQGNKPNQKGFVGDQQAFEKVQTWISQELQRRHLNDVFGGMPTTNENICHWLYYAFKGLISAVSAVELSDEPGNSCRYSE